jgi:small subunit ribosomal protein S21
MSEAVGPVRDTEPTQRLSSRKEARVKPGGDMVEVQLAEGDRIEWALKAFKRKVMRSGILKDLRSRRHYVKPSEARQIKSAAARRRERSRSKQ